MNDLMIKEFEGNQVHTFIWNDRPCWIANEIISTFNYADPSTTIGQCIDAEEFEAGIEYDLLKGSIFTEFATNLNLVANNLISNMTRQLTIFYEDGLYGFLQYTDKPIGVKFRKWLRREVLPEIRKTGSFNSNKQRSPFDYKERIKFLNSISKSVSGMRKSYMKDMIMKNMFEDMLGVELPDPDPEEAPAAVEPKIKIHDVYFQRFIDEYCDIGPKFKVIGTELHALYREWAINNNIAIKQIGHWLRLNGFEYKSIKFNGKNHKGWSGIKIKDEYSNTTAMSDL